MITSQDIKGSITAIVTPFKKSGEIDEQGLRENIEFQIKGNSAGIVPVGTTGVSPTVTPQEHKGVIEIAVDAAGGRIPVIAGTGANSTSETIEYTRYAEDVGADAALLVAPYYNKPSQEGLYAHFKKVAGSVDIPLILYNIQGRTAVNIEVNTITRLSKLNNIIGVKEASGNLNQMSAIIEATKDEDFVLVSGDDSLTLPVLALGGKGVISVAANIVPEKIAEMVSMCLEGDYENARALHYELMPLFRVLFIETSPAPIKYAMGLLNMPSGDVRLPLVAPEDENKRIIENVLRDMELI